MDTRQRIRALLEERGWSEYRLAVEAGLSQSTIANIFNRNTTPSVSTLERVCDGFGITLAQFFSTGNLVELSEDQMEMFQSWRGLTQKQKTVLTDLIRVMKNGK